MIDSDNRLFHFVDLEHLEDVEARWESIPEISRLVNTLVVLDEHQEVVLFLTNEQTRRARWFRGLLNREIINDLEIGVTMVDRHKHLHARYSGRYYLLSYITRRVDGRLYTVCVSNDVDEIVERTFPELLADPRGRRRFNVADQDGRIIFGDRLAGAGDFIVAHPFPTTFYRWRLQVAPLHAPELEARARQKNISDAILIGLALGIIVLGMIVFIVAAAKERRLSRLRSEFVSNVTHELKTPLSLIKMFSELLVMGKVNEDKRQRYCEIIHRESDRLGALIDTVLDFSRLERGKRHYEKVAVDLSDVLRRAVDISRARLERDTLELTLKVEESIPLVLADEQAVTLAVINLVDNASKYADGSDEIRVLLRQVGRCVHIVVEDDGPGIPADDLRRIFERFYRGRAATQNQARGSGIGLSIVQAVAEGHGGRVWAESANQEGARFTIELPGLTA